MIKKLPFKIIVEASVFIGIIALFINYSILSYLQKDGFSLMETSFNSFISGFLFLFLCIIIPSYFLRKYYKDINNKTNKYLLLIIILVLSIMINIILDFILFQFDSSISKDLSLSLLEIPSVSKSINRQVIYDLRYLPISLINWSTNAIFGGIGIFISSILIKQNK